MKFKLTFITEANFTQDLFVWNRGFLHKQSFKKMQQNQDVSTWSLWSWIVA